MLRVVCCVRNTTNEKWLDCKLRCGCLGTFPDGPVENDSLPRPIPWLTSKSPSKSPLLTWCYWPSVVFISPTPTPIVGSSIRICAAFLVIVIRSQDDIGSEQSITSILVRPMMAIASSAIWCVLWSGIGVKKRLTALFRALLSSSRTLTAYASDKLELGNSVNWPAPDPRFGVQNRFDFVEFKSWVLT